MKSLVSKLTAFGVGLALLMNPGNYADASIPKTKKKNIPAKIEAGKKIVDVVRDASPVVFRHFHDRNWNEKKDASERYLWTRKGEFFQDSYIDGCIKVKGYENSIINVKVVDAQTGESFFDVDHDINDYTFTGEDSKNIIGLTFSAPMFLRKKWRKESDGVVYYRIKIQEKNGEKRYREAEFSVDFSNEAPRTKKK